uniref:Uncharacterized protein n=1 Tax=Vespula pensylvanica TaxID=30213 RepID=A0A834NJY8_VESPE|nr:hypothetical protein H0235_012771 [Vespula pensylvanica]
MGGWVSGCCPGLGWLDVSADRQVLLCEDRRFVELEGSWTGKRVGHWVVGGVGGWLVGECPGKYGVRDG